MELLQPASLQEALELLAARGEDAKVVAGCTAVSILLRNRFIEPDALVSIRRLDELRGIDIGETEVAVGALTTHAAVARDEDLAAVLPAVGETFAVVGNVRIRNVATVGGVLAEADYASDPPVMLLVLDAAVDVAGAGTVRTLPLQSLFLGFLETSLEPGELITRLRIPRLPVSAAAVYEKFVTRSAEDRPCLGVAAVVDVAEDGTAREIRVGLGGATEVPVRVPELEARAQGLRITPASAGELADAYAEAVEPLSDLRGSAWYRRRMIRVWVRRTVLRAHQRAVDRSSSGL